MKRYRPKNGYDAVEHLKKGTEIEVVNTFSFQASKIIKEIGKFSFSFKKNKWNKGWAGFKKF